MIYILFMIMMIVLLIIFIVDFKQSEKLVKLLEEEKKIPKIIKPNLTDEEAERLKEQFEESKKQFENLMKYDYDVALGKGSDE